MLTYADIQISNGQVAKRALKLLARDIVKVLSLPRTPLALLVQKYKCCALKLLARDIP
jgi:hypothetical protein